MTGRKKGKTVSDIGIVSTQIRIPAEMNNYMQQESDRIGIAKNAFLLILLEQGRKLWEADVTHLFQVK